MRLVHWIAALPCIIMLAGVVLHNKVFPLLLWLPFPLGWIALWIVMTSVVMAFVYSIDKNNKTETGDNAR